VVLIEGLYAFLNTEPWREASELLDRRWFVDVDFEEAKARLVKRHVVSGVASDMENAIWRADENDMPSEFPFPLRVLKGGPRMLLQMADFLSSIK
jgi:pantothenate kinase